MCKIYLNVEAVEGFAIYIIAFIFSQGRRDGYVCTVYTAKHPGKPYEIVGCKGTTPMCGISNMWLKELTMISQPF